MGQMDVGRAGVPGGRMTVSRKQILRTVKRVMLVDIVGRATQRVMYPWLVVHKSANKSG